MFCKTVHPSGNFKIIHGTQCGRFSNGRVRRSCYRVTRMTCTTITVNRKPYMVPTRRIFSRPCVDRIPDGSGKIACKISANNMFCFFCFFQQDGRRELDGRGKAAVLVQAEAHGGHDPSQDANYREYMPPFSTVEKKDVFFTDIKCPHARVLFSVSRFLYCTVSRSGRRRRRRRYYYCCFPCAPP